MRVFIVLLALPWLSSCEPTPPKTTVSAPGYALQLAVLAAADQADRQRLFALFKQYGFQSTQADSGNRWLPRRDSGRFVQFRALLGRYGWPRSA